MNLVNKVHNNNRHMNLYTAEELLEMFKNGLRMDIDKLYKYHNIAPHAEIDPEFISIVTVG